MMKKFVIIVLCLSLFACQTLSSAVSESTQVKIAKGCIAAVTILQKAAVPVMRIGCGAATFDSVTCNTYYAADKAATAALAAANLAMNNYLKDSSTANAGILETATNALYSAWTAYNDINHITPFVDQNGNPLQ